MSHALSAHYLQAQSRFVDPKHKTWSTPVVFGLVLAKVREINISLWLFTVSLCTTATLLVDFALGSKTTPLQVFTA